MTGRSNVSIDGYLPHPIFTARSFQDNVSSAPMMPLVTEGPPLSNFENTSAPENPSPKSSPGLLLLKSKPLETQASRHLAQLIKAYPWFSLKEIRRPENTNFAQLLFDDGLLQKSVSDYITLLDSLDYVFDLTFSYGTNCANEQNIRENGCISIANRVDLLECTFFHFSASQARSFGTCVVRGRLDKSARVGEIEDKKQSWELLRRYFDNIADTFASSSGLSPAEKHDLQNHLAARVLEEQELDGAVINHPVTAWKSLLMLNPDMMVLEFN